MGEDNLDSMLKREFTECKEFSFGVPTFGLEPFCKQSIELKKPFREVNCYECEYYEIKKEGD